MGGGLGRGFTKSAFPLLVFFERSQKICLAKIGPARFGKIKLRVGGLP
jgi:hypothetical protein